MSFCWNKKKNIVFLAAGIAFSSIVALLILRLWMWNNKTCVLSSEKNVLSIETTGKKSKNSWGSEARLRSVFINGTELAFEELEITGWTKNEGELFLFSDGVNNSRIDITMPSDVNDISINFVTQEGSGKVSILFNGKKIALCDLYSSEWNNLECTMDSFMFQYQLRTKYLSCLVGVLIVLCIIVYISSDKRFNKVEHRNSIGMFDFAKGICLTVVVFSHCTDLFKYSEISESLDKSLVLGVLYLLLLYGAMPMFFMASGYNFRKGPVKNTFKRQVAYLLKPYGIIALLTVISVVLRSLILGIDILDVAYHVIPFVIGNPHPMKVGFLTVNSIGPMWFAVSLCGAWTIFNIISNVKYKAIRIALLLLCVATGYWLTLLDFSIWSAAITFSVVIFLYLGTLLKKSHLLILKNDSKSCSLYFALFILAVLLAGLNGFSFGIAGNDWGNNILVGLLAGLLCGIILLRVSVILNDKKIIFSKCIKWIGRNSFSIFYIHALEYLCIPWEEIAKSLSYSVWTNIIIVFFCRIFIMIVIFASLDLIKRVDRQVISRFTFAGTGLALFGIVAIILGYFYVEHNEIPVPSALRPHHAEEEQVDSYTSPWNVKNVDNSSLPRIDIVLDDDYLLSKLNYTECIISVQNAGESNIPSSPGKIKIRGNSTSLGAKKPYKIKFSESKSLFSGGEAKNWVLLANASDPTLLHNYVGFRIYDFLSSDDVFVPMCVFVDLYINNKFQGVYALCDQVESGYTRVPIDKNIKETPAKTDYLIVQDFRAYYDNSDSGKEGLGWFWMEKKNKAFAVKSPNTDKDTYTEEYTDFIKSKLDDIYDIILSKDWIAIQTVLDIESVINVFLTSAITMNHDITLASVYYYLPAGDKLHCGPAWDLDLTFGCGGHSIREDSMLDYTNNFLLKALLEVPEFNTMFEEKYRSISPEIETFICNEVDTICSLYHDELANEYDNFESWTKYGNDEIMGIDDYDSQIEYMKMWTKNRIKCLDRRYSINE